MTDDDEFYPQTAHTETMFDPPKKDMFQVLGELDTGPELEPPVTDEQYQARAKGDPTAPDLDITEEQLVEMVSDVTNTDDDTVLDLDHLPESGEERLKLGVELLKTVRSVVDELGGDFDPSAVKVYADELKSMLDDAVSLYNLMVGKWALAKVYQAGELVYFDYFNMTHIGKIKTIAKHELLIEFEHTPKNRPGSEARHIETWRRKDQVRKP
jgi:hypothetical protein